jgi:hypothetical protein
LISYTKILLTVDTTYAGGKGNIYLTVSGGTPGYTFHWSDTSTNQNDTGLFSGIYSVTVTDAHGCTADTTISLIFPSSVSITMDSCNGLITGIEPTVVDKTAHPPFTYHWNSTDTTHAVDSNGRFIPMIPGVYYVTVTVIDSNNNTFVNRIIDSVPNYNVTPQTLRLPSGQLNYGLSDIYALGAYNGLITGWPGPVFSGTFPVIYQQQVHFEGILIIDSVPPFAQLALGNLEPWRTAAIDTHSIFTVVAYENWLGVINSHLTFGPGAEVVVNYRSHLYVSGGLWEGCDYMWKGITITEDGSPNPCYLPSTDTAQLTQIEGSGLTLISGQLNGDTLQDTLTIRDALFAVQLGTYGNCQSDFVHFDANFISLYADSSNICSMSQFPGGIVDSDFTCSHQLKKYFGDTLMNCAYNAKELVAADNLLPNLPAQNSLPDRKSFAGIWIEQENNFAVGGNLDTVYFLTVQPLAVATTASGSSQTIVAQDTFYFAPALYPEIPNTFHNTAIGIGAVNSTLTVQDSRFFDLPDVSVPILNSYRGNLKQGYGIVQKQDGDSFPSFSNLTVYGGYRAYAYDFENITNTAIYAARTQLTVDSVTINNVKQGIEARGKVGAGIRKEVTIEDCLINANLSGIYLNNGEPYKTLQVTNNTITTGGGDSLSTGIGFDEPLKAQQSANAVLSITHNVINAGGYCGIYMNGGNRDTVAHNTIHLQNVTNNFAGIYLANHKDVLITNDSVIGTGQSNSNVFQYPTIHPPCAVYTSTTKTGNSFVACNTIYNTNTGIHFAFAVLLTFAESNQFQDLDIGLRVEDTAMVSAHRKISGVLYSTVNNWIDSSGIYDAENDNIKPIFINPFYTNSPTKSYGSDYPPTIYVGDTSFEWFRPGFTVIPDSDLDCGLGTFNLPIFSNGIDTLDYFIAEDSFEETGPLNEALQRYLLDKLLLDTSLISTDTLFASFISRMASPSPAGQFRELDSLIASATEPSEAVQSFIDSLENLQAGNNAIQNAYSLIIDSLSATVASSTATNVAPLNSEIASMLGGGGEEGPELPGYGSAYETYHELVDAIYLNTLAVGIDTFTTGDSSQLHYIANLCPLLAGTAVFEARAMYALIANQYYWDEAACSGYSYRDLSVPVRSDSVIQSSVIKIYPNPASDKLILDWLSPKNESADIVIVDMMGQQILEQTVKSNTGHIFIDVTSFNVGTYLTTLQSVNGLIYKTKTVIMK